MTQSIRHHVAHVIFAPDRHIPDGFRAMLDYAGWQAFPVGETGCEQPTILRWREAPVGSQGRIRLVPSVDHREDVLIEAFLPESGRVIGVFDIRYPAVCEPSEITVLREELEGVAREGLGLRMVQGERAIWFVYGEGENTPVPDALQPHIIVPMGQSPAHEFIHRMLSLASIQAFGWLEGCVLDGLNDFRLVLGEERVGPALRQHLEQFFTEDRRLRYIDTRSMYYEERIYGTEGTLPFAVIAREWPDHPSLDIAISFWKERINAAGMVRDGSTVTAEACYITAYPMAVVGTVRSQPELCQMALQQLRIRTAVLAKEDAFFPQVRDDGSRPFASWGRGCVWYLLGLVRTLQVLGEDGSSSSVDAEVEAECRRFARWIAQYQREDGTWSAYIDDPSTGSDTSTTAGLGAAYAWGVLTGILPDEFIDRAARALHALLRYLTPDGFLTGASPENKGGERLQRGGHRAISQISMGLMAQLVAGLAVYEQQKAKDALALSVSDLFGLRTIFGGVRSDELS